MAIVRRTLKQIRESFDVDKFDWSKFDATTEEDIDRQIALDPDTAPEATDADLARARRVYPPDFVDVRAVRAKLEQRGTARRQTGNAARVEYANPVPYFKN